MIWEYRSERAERRARAGRSSWFPEARKFYLAGRMRRRDTIALPRRTLFFVHFRDLLIARPPGQKRNGKLTWNGRATKRLAASAVYPPRTKDGSITHAFYVPMITRRRERPVRFSEPSIAFTSYFTHPRMVNFVQSWQRVSADRPIAVGRPSRAFEMKLKTRARWILFVLREDWRKNAARRQFESNRASNRIFLSLFVFNCVFTYINTYLFHFENFYIPFSIYFIISLYMYIICFKK